MGDGEKKLGCFERKFWSEKSSSKKFVQKYEKIKTEKRNFPRSCFENYFLVSN